MKKSNVKNLFLLVLAAFIWGTAFIAQSVSMDYIEPFTFNATRYVIGALVLLPVLFFLKKRSIKRGDNSYRPFDKNVLTAGIICGLILFASSTLQQFGLVSTAPGKAGFITALYIIIVPILGIFFKKKTTVFLWIGVALATLGLYFLCITDSFSIQTEDLLILLCAVGFSFHIMVIDHYSPIVNGVMLSAIQFGVAAVLCTICMFIFETPTPTAIADAWFPIVYTGVFSCGVAYTLQIVGQENVSPVVASLLLSLESVFAVISDVVLLHEKLTGRELAGCILMFVAIILAELPSPSRRKS